MFIQRFLKQAKVADAIAVQQRQPRSDQRDEARRTQRMAKLADKLRRERKSSAERAAQQDEIIAGLKEALAQYGNNDANVGRSRHVLEQDLDVATQMLDEFEAEALNSRAALEQVETLQDEARVHKMIIRELEAELAQRDYPKVSAA